MKKMFFKTILVLGAVSGMMQGQLLASSTQQIQPEYIIRSSLTKEAIGQLPALKEIQPDLYKLKLDLSNEIIYELVGTEEGLGWSFAIADIIQSEPHYHTHTCETYVMVTGILEVSVNDQKHVLYPGDVITIPINSVHSARSLTDLPARILVSCVPGWTFEDHIHVK